MRGKAQQVLCIILNIISLISKAEEVYKDDTKIINKNNIIYIFIDSLMILTFLLCKQIEFYSN